MCIRDRPEPEPEPAEPQEVWQWQLNCVSRGFLLFHRPMPQTFGILIGTQADAEARVKASVCLPNSYTIRETKWQDRTTYEFTDSEIVEGRPAMRQEGGIRCVSRDLKLIRRWEGAPIPPQMDSPCLLYTSPSPRDRTRSRMPSSA